MKRLKALGAVLILTAITSADARAQPDPVEPEAPIRWGGEVLRVFHDYTVAANERIGDLVVIAGNTTVEGRVDGDVVVILGKAQLSSSAVIDGSLVVIGGSTDVAAGATVDRDLVIVAGSLDAPAAFTSGGEHIVIGPAVLGGGLDRVVPWVTRGLLWGRPIVPSLPWIWGIVAIVFLAYLAINLVFDRPVRACATTLAARPLTTLVVGLAVPVLLGPVLLLLTVSVIGIAVIPFLVCALLVAAILGRVGVVRWIGMRVIPEDGGGLRLQPVLTFVVGFAVIVVTYMVPILGFISWMMIGVFGLGAATLAFMSAYRRERPAPPPRPDVRPPAGYPPPIGQPHVEGLPGEAGPPLQEGGTATGLGSTPAWQAVASAALAAGPPAAAGAGTGSGALATFPHAVFVERLAAFVLDIALVGITVGVLDLHENAFLFVLLAYHIGFWTWKGTTIGGIICQLRVVRVDGAPLGFVDALVRGLSSLFSLAALGLGALWILKDPERQAWHDKIAGTYVVKVPRNWPL
jgi:uncharacterized RDD family membrane protein YckC